MYNAIDVANYIILYCKKQGYSISNLKLQKLLYFVQAQFLVSCNKPCFNADIEAWDFGPVVPDVYHNFKYWGSSDIPDIFAEGAEKKIKICDQKIIDAVLSGCASYSAAYLVELTHDQSPWKKAYNGMRNQIISLDSIKEYFS